VTVTERDFSRRPAPAAKTKATTQGVLETFADATKVRARPLSFGVSLGARPGEAFGTAGSPSKKHERNR